MVEPASGPQRSRPSSAQTAKVNKEKRKRSRVTPEQLVHLEQFFAMDRSPTAGRRKEISDLLGMQERQTQIWFQNRRAKAKLQDGKKGRDTSPEAPPEAPPQLVTGYQAELHNLLREDEPVTIIPCTDLSVGTWRRIVASPEKHDLVAYLSDAKRCLTWFIHSSGFGFKMEIPFDIILKTDFTNRAPGTGLASFFLSRPPTFYLETPLPSNPGQGIQQGSHWKKCADWTEDQQATKVLRHDLVGSAVQLAHVLRHLNVHASGSDIRLHSPTYHSQEPSPPVLEMQPPPLTAFANTPYHYHSQDNVEAREPDHPTLAHKRSFSSPVPSQQLSLHETLRPSASPPGAIPEPDSSMYPHYLRHPAMQVDRSISYASSSETALPQNVSHSSDGRSPFSSCGSRQQPYTAGSVHSLPYENDSRSRILSFPENFQPHRGDVPMPFEPLSPPLLTTPYYPAGSTSLICPASTFDPGIPLSGMHGRSISDHNA